MKGMVFTEFFEMVEATFSADMVDDIIDDANVPSGGVYTSVGTYDHAEIVALVIALSTRTGIAVPDLLKAFGKYLFNRFSQGYRQFFESQTDAFAFLAGIENIIHAEVRKLYPDAQLPRFDVEHQDAKELVLIYRSGRHFEDLAEGLLQGCVAYFDDSIVIARSTLGQGDERCERFVLTREG